MGNMTSSVFSTERSVLAPAPALPPALKSNTRLKMDGLRFLSLIDDAQVPVAFLDPQYRGVLERLSYGNEGESRGRRRAALEQMDEATISHFIEEIDRVLIPSGHLFLWVDKFHLCQGLGDWPAKTSLDIVDLVTWDKGTIGMGYRTRRRAEYCLVLQKLPRKAKGVWKSHDIPDVVEERVLQRQHPHAKPTGLQGSLLAAVSNKGDIVIDPAAGSFSVMDAAMEQGRVFLGCDRLG